MCITEQGKLSSPMQTRDPFLFAVYHNDQYPKGNLKMEAPRRGNGQDFSPNQAYRMYHGDRIPGFPSHPHKGFETITATIQGLVDHTDSLGCSGRYGNGDVQWMTAGKGIVHAENFPLINMDEPNPLKLVQIWLNLPAKNKLVKASQLMHWAEDVKKYQANGVEARIFAGEFQGITALTPGADSWSFDKSNDVGIFFLIIQSNCSVSLPSTIAGTNRSIYFIHGSQLSVNSSILESESFAHIQNNIDITLMNAGSDEARVLVLQGQPINEPIAKHGPFVMNTQTEISQAIKEYQATGFGGWPWPSETVVFERTKGRFVSDGQIEIHPPST